MSRPDPKFTASRLLRVLGGACAAAGFLAWGGLLWTAIASLEDVTPEGEGGGRLVLLGLTGTLLMIAGMILLHVAADAAERDERTPPEGPASSGG